VNYQDGTNKSVSPIWNLGMIACPSGGFIAGIVGQACIHVSLYLFLDSKICLSIRVGNNGPVTAIAVAGGNNPGGLHAWILQPV